MGDARIFVVWGQRRGRAKGIRGQKHCRAYVIDIYSYLGACRGSCGDRADGSLPSR